MAFLPARDPPTGQRYRLSLSKVREELNRYLPAARTEAAERLQKLVNDGAPDSRIVAERVELAYVRHAKGPVYQSHLLNFLGQRDVEAVISAEPTPLERVREIGAALAARIKTQQPAAIQRVVRSLERPILPPGQSAAHERLAEAFLKNPPDQNRLIPASRPPRLSWTGRRRHRLRGVIVRAWWKQRAMRRARPSLPISARASLLTRE